MKLKKPINQIRSFLQRLTNGGAYRGLSIIMAALLFCSANSQVMAGSMPIGANYTADASASPVSGDKFNAVALLKESAPSDQDSQPLTFTQKLEIAGAAFLILAGGGTYAFKAGYLDRFKGGDRSGGADSAALGVTEEEQKRALSAESASSGDSNSSQPRNSIWSGIIEGTFGTGTQQTEVVASSEGAAAPSRLETAKAALKGWAQKGWDLVTLKDCRAAEAVVTTEDKSFFEHLTELHVAHQKVLLADQKAARSLGQKVWDFIVLKQHVVQDDRTPMQQSKDAANAFADIKHAQLTPNQLKLVQEHHDRADKFKNITVDSSPEEMLSVLDPEMEEPASMLIEEYVRDQNSSEEEQQGKELLYFIVKNHDNLTPGKLRLLVEAGSKVEGANNESQQVASKVEGGNDQSQQALGAENKALWDKLNQEVKRLWNSEIGNLQKRKTLLESLSQRSDDAKSPGYISANQGRDSSTGSAAGKGGIFGWR